MSWYSKKQHTILRSSIKVEYRNLTNIGAKIALLFSLLRELNGDIHKTLVVWYDNLSTIMLAVNLDLHAKTKHIKLDLYLVREKVLHKRIKILHLPSLHQTTYVVTKPISNSRFPLFRFKLKSRTPHSKFERGSWRKSLAISLIYSY